MRLPCGRNASFYITEGIKLYGGFNGTEIALSQRPTAHSKPTILSGDIDGNDVNTDGNLISESYEDSKGDNAIFVVVIDGSQGKVNITQGTILDGFIITAGFNNISRYSSRGSGIYCAGQGQGNACSPLLSHLHIIGNLGLREGGGLYNNGRNGGEASPVVEYVVFTGNRSHSHGGAVLNDGRDRGTSSPRFLNTRFHKNFSGSGSAIFNFSSQQGVSNPFIYNAVFSENKAGRSTIYSGGHGGISSNITLINALFINNKTRPGSHTQYYCTAITNNGREGNKANATLINVTIADHIVPSNAYDNNGAICNDGRNGEAHLTIHNSILWNNTGRVAGQIYNYAGQTTIAHTLIQGGVANGIHNASGSTTVDNGNNIDTDPQFTDAANHDYTLKVTSPAINTGNNAVLPADITTDILGNARIQLDTVDMGAYESASAAN